MRDLVIIGAGGSAAELVGTVEAVNAVEPTFSLIGFLDDSPAKQGTSVCDLPIIGTVDRAADMNDAMFVIGIAHYRRPRCRADMATRLGMPRERYATIIHPNAIVSTRARVGSGVLVLGFAMVSPGAVVGDHAFIGPYSHVSHDAIVEDGGTLAAGALMCGTSKLCTGGYMGARSVLMDGMCVGNGAVVGIGGVVIRDVAADTVVVGNPAKPVKGRIES